MKKRLDLQSSLIFAACLCYLLVLVFYVIDSIAMHGFLYQIISIGPYLLLSLISGAIFSFQVEYLKPFFPVVSFVFSLLKTMIFFAFFFFIDMQNLRAINFRMLGTATTPATIGDVFFFICTIAMAAVVLISFVLENVVFILYCTRKKISN